MSPPYILELDRLAEQATSVARSRRGRLLEITVMAPRDVDPHALVDVMRDRLGDPQLKVSVVAGPRLDLRNLVFER